MNSSAPHIAVQFTFLTLVYLTVIIDIYYTEDFIGVEVKWDRTMLHKNGAYPINECMTQEMHIFG